ncbi:NADAR family protein [Maricaulis sp.]|uniref:NADAR family protein n=1 Tax=Maricaulis sp. TaxID=1486257 RepID=UPI0026189BC4|nr:NADAR family protein [Maricaulis sp.]
MKYSRDWALKRRKTVGRELQCRPFWGHRGRSDGVISASCLSQWFPSPFKQDGDRYRTAEHWMMAQKARLFGDTKIVRSILASDDPRQVKALGRKIKAFDSAVWDQYKYDIVVRGNALKFSQNPPLRDYLLKTADLVLVEASPVDPVWGIGLAADDKGVCDPACWKGENLLGFALMEVRDQLRHEGRR